MNPSYGTVPIKPDKGIFNGSCNRTRCQEPGATWWNRVEQAYYCIYCACLLNRAFRDKPRNREAAPLCAEHIAHGQPKPYEAIAIRQADGLP